MKIWLQFVPDISLCICLIVLQSVLDWDLGKVSSRLVALPCATFAFLSHFHVTQTVSVNSACSPFIIDCPSLEASQFHLCTHKCTAEREATQSPNESSQSRALHHALRLGAWRWSQRLLLHPWIRRHGRMSNREKRQKSNKETRGLLLFSSFPVNQDQDLLLAHYAGKECITNLWITLVPYVHVSCTVLPILQSPISGTWGFTVLCPLFPYQGAWWKCVLKSGVSRFCYSHELYVHTAVGQRFDWSLST